ncbi:MAG: spherulation-specific family 4 protein [Candidatus Eisenbacteria bacterium]
MPAVLAAWLAACPAAAADRMGLLVPAYQYPTLGTLWADCAAAATRVPLVAVLDPASGPGTGVDPTYTAAVGAVRAAGGRVVGYVPTFGGETPAESVLVQVDRYRAWYALDGIFLDLMANDASPAHVAYYAAVRESIRAREHAWLVIGNPGTTTQEAYVTGADVLCDFEYYGEGYFGWTPEPWAHAYPPRRFAHLLHSLSTADSMRAAVARACALGAGWVFATPDTMVNPYDETPAYWSALVAAVETTFVANVPDAPPAAHAALRAWPVPARGDVQFAPIAAGARSIEVFDLSGRCVARLPASPGRAVRWDARGVPAGLYLARAVGSRAPATRLVLVR